MNKQHPLLLALCLMASISLISQTTSNIQQQMSVNNGGSPPDASAMLDVQSTTQGMLVPRMTTAQRNAIASPATGLLVFDTQTGSFWFFDGTTWTNLSAPKQLADADGNTNLKVEKNPNEDVIRMALGGSERLVIRKNSPNSHTQLLLTGNNGHVFLGNHAGDSTSTGVQNVFIGENAGRKNKTGNGNSFLGFAAGEMGTNTYSNTFVGYEAGRNNTSGDNTYVGYFAGKNTTNGGQNVFLGSFTGVNNTSGSYNTFLGRYAGQLSETGFNNTFVGYGSGSSNVAGSGNVCLGFNAGINEQGSNKLYIENSSITTPLIWGDFFTDRVGINIVASTNTLEVGGTASKASAGEWLGNSDARLKKNIRPLNSKESLEKMLSLHGVTYEWADNKTGIMRPEGMQYGFTAQNIQVVFPSLVKEDQLGYLQTAYGTFDAMTVEAMRALNDKITNLKDENASLKDRLARLEAAVLELSARKGE